MPHSKEVDFTDYSKSALAAFLEDHVSEFKLSGGWVARKLDKIEQQEIERKKALLNELLNDTRMPEHEETLRSRQAALRQQERALQKRQRA